MSELLPDRDRHPRTAGPLKPLAAAHDNRIDQPVGRTALAECGEGAGLNFKLIGFRHPGRTAGVGASTDDDIEPINWSHDVFEFMKYCFVRPINSAA